MSIPKDWIELRRGDGELIGWIGEAEDGFIAIDLLGRAVTDEIDWLTAEEALEDLGIGYLADPFELLLDDGRWLEVRIIEVSAESIRVKREDWGAMDIPQEEYTVPFPMPSTLRPRTRPV